MVGWQRFEHKIVSRLQGPAAGLLGQCASGTKPDNFKPNVTYHVCCCPTCTLAHYKAPQEDYAKTKSHKSNARKQSVKRSRVQVSCTLGKNGQPLPVPSLLRLSPCRLRLRPLARHRGSRFREPRRFPWRKTRKRGRMRCQHYWLYCYWR